MVQNAEGLCDPFTYTCLLMFRQNVLGLSWVDRTKDARACHLKRWGEAGWWFSFDGSSFCTRWRKAWLLGGGGRHTREKELLLVMAGRLLLTEPLMILTQDGPFCARRALLSSCH